MARAQDPVILPQLPGASFPAGELPPARPPDSLDDGTATDDVAAGERPSFGLSGDWLGARTRLGNDGIELKANATQFYQGTARGGFDETFRYGLKFDYFGVVTGEKLVGWHGFYVYLHGETRAGDSVNDNAGTLLPVDFALFFPQPAGTVTALTNLQFQQFLSDDFVVTLGKINTADGVNIHPFMGGYGTDRFLNTAFVINPMLGRVLPYSTPGAAFSYLRDYDPVFTILLVDPMGQPGSSGLDNLFRNGVSLFAQLRIPVTPLGLRGHRTIELAYSNAAFSSLSRDDYVINPGAGAGVTVVQQAGSWAFNCGFDQLLVVDPDDDRRGWGVFGNLGLSDGDPNPIRWFLNLGLAGRSLVPRRPHDSFGLAFFYLGASSVLKDLLPIGDEQGCELYYDAAVTSWFRLTADLQAIDPGQRAAETAFLLGLRGKIIF